MTNSLEPRDGGAILGDAFRIYGRNLLGLWAIAAAVLLVLGVLGGVASYLTYGADVGWHGDFRYLPLTWLLSLLQTALSVVGIPLMAGALIHAVSRQHFARPVDLRRSYRFAWRRLGSLLGAVILYALALICLSITLIGIPVAVYLGVRWVFCAHAVLLEGLGPTEALSRSWSLVKGSWWRTFGILVLAWIIGLVIGAVSWLLWWVAPPAASYFVGTVVMIVAFPLGVTIVTLLYYDTRLKKETYSLNALAYELGIEPGRAAA